MSVRILIGDCRERMAELEADSIDSCVCDPPYHLTSIVKRFGAANAAPVKAGKTGAYVRVSRGFMGQQWDGGDVAFDPATWESVLRVLKPGAHLVAFSGTRTYHRMACAIEDAGFEIRDQLAWVYGSGFPKSHNQPGGWGTALKPAWEPICLARKPLAGTVAGNVLKWGTGAINIDATRIGGQPSVGERKGGDSNGHTAHSRIDDRGNCTRCIERAASSGRLLGGNTLPLPSASSHVRRDPEFPGSLSDCPACRRFDDEQPRQSEAASQSAAPCGADVREPRGHQPTGSDTLSNLSKPCADNINVDIESLGRWPANIIHDGSDEVLAGFPDSVSTGGQASLGAFRDGKVYGAGRNEVEKRDPGFGDSGSAARFFYCAKATTEERGEGNNHPTVKPVDLMRWLCRLVTPKGGTVLDPFAGSGSTLIAADAEQFNAIGCELSPAYAEIAERRVRDAAGMFAEVQAA